METKQEIEKKYQEMGQQLTAVIINGIADNLVNNHSIVGGLINQMYNLRVDHAKIDKEEKKVVNNEPINEIK